MSTVDPPWRHFPLTGRLVSISLPSISEYDLITSLRNRVSVRRWFFDSRELDTETNRTWLQAHQMNIQSQILSIRLCYDGSFVGFVGWSDFDDCLGSIRLGGIALDLGVCRTLARKLGYAPRVADEAGELVVDFAFAVLGVRRVLAVVLRNNQSSASLCRRVGLCEVGTGEKRSRDGELVPFTSFELTRAEWQPRRLEAKRTRR